MVRTLLEVKVDLMNQANALANHYHLLLREFFLPLVGKKVLKSNNWFLADVEKLLPKVEEGYFEGGSPYSLYWKFKKCVSFGYGSGCGRMEFQEVVVHVADISAGRVYTVHPIETRRTDYTVEEVELQRNVVRHLKSQYDEALCKLLPFGE